MVRRPIIMPVAPDDSMTPFTSEDVAAKFAAYPAHVRPRLLALRDLILRTADATDGVGGIDETLKWGEPAYVTTNRSGSTVRIDWKEGDPQHYAMYFNCQTTLVDDFRFLFPDDFTFDGNRALIFGLEDEVPEDALAECVAAALTYHRRKRRAVKGRR